MRSWQLLETCGERTVEHRTEPVRVQGSPGVATKSCPKCGDSFIESIRRCPDCGVLLSESRVGAPSDDGSGEPDDAAPVVVEPETRGGQLVYALNEWSTEERMLVEQLLVATEIPRAWEGTNLVVPAGIGAQVDPILAQATSWTAAGLADDGSKIVYELGEWTDSEVSRLIEKLQQLGVPHEFTSEGDLVVLEEDEARVESLFDSIEFPDALDPDLDADASSGLDTQAVLSDLFVAVDRLRRHARSAEGVLGLVASAKTIQGFDVPFGFAPAVWNDIVTQATALREAIEGDAELDDQIEERAGELRSLLRDYV